MKDLFLKSAMITATCLSVFSAMGMDLPEVNDDIEIFLDPADSPEVELEDLDVDAFFVSTAESHNNKRSWSEREEDTTEAISQPPQKKAKAQEKTQLSLFLKSSERGDIRSLKKGLCELIANQMDFAQMKQILLDVTPIEEGGSDDFLVSILDAMDMERLLQVWINLEEETSTNTTTANTKDNALSTLKESLIFHIQRSGIPLDFKKLMENWLYWFVPQEKSDFLLKTPFSKMRLETCLNISEMGWANLAVNDYVKELHVCANCENDVSYLKRLFDLLLNENNTIKIKSLCLHDFWSHDIVFLLGNFIGKYPLETIELQSNKKFGSYNNEEKNSFYNGLLANGTLKNIILKNSTFDAVDVMKLTRKLCEREAPLDCFHMEDPDKIIEANDIISIVRQLMTANKGLTKLYFNNCHNIKNADFQQLLDVLKENETVTHLSFERNNICDLNVVLDFVKSNKTLQHLNLSFNEFTLESYNLIEEILNESPNLHLCIFEQGAMFEGITEEGLQELKLLKEHLKETFGDRIS